jgi:transposase
MNLASAMPETESTSTESLMLVCVERGRKIAALEGELTALREALRKRDTAYTRLEGQHVELADAYTRLERERDQLLRRFVQPTTEKLAPDQLQLSFAGEASVATSATTAAGSTTADSISPPSPSTEPGPAGDAKASAAKPRRKGHGRKKLPPNLKRVPNRIEPPADQLVCACGKHKVEIRCETSEKLERVPATLYVIETSRPIYACPDGCEQSVVCAPAPYAWIDRSLGGPGLHAWVLVAKFGDHLPLNRISGILAREGARIATSTLGDWVKHDADALSPIYQAIRKDVLESPIVRTDDTSLRVLDKATQPGGAYNGRVWAFLAVHKGDVFFAFSETRKNADPEGCHAVLKAFQGYLQADASNGYDALFKNKKILECGCWAHCRRKFHEARDAFPRQADQAIALIQRLYQVEREAKLRELDPGAIRALRLERSRPILEEFFEWVRRIAPEAVPRSLLATALGYALNQEAALRRYLEDGRLEIDNNDTERALRHVVTGRKAWLFAGNDEGGRRTAVLSTLVYSCKELGIDPVVYLTDVLKKLTTHPGARVHELTPRRWLAAQKAASPAC